MFYSILVHEFHLFMVLQRCHTHLTCIKNFEFLKKRKKRKLCSQKICLKLKYWPENDTDFICFDYFRTEKRLSNTKNEEAKLQWTISTKNYKFSRPFRFLLCSEIIVQLMVICKKKNSSTQFCIQFYFAQCYSLSLTPMETVKWFSSQCCTQRVAQSSPKLNKIDGKTWVDQRLLLPWHGKAP